VAIDLTWPTRCTAVQRPGCQERGEVSRSQHNPSSGVAHRSRSSSVAPNHALADTIFSFDSTHGAFFNHLRCLLGLHYCLHDLPFYGCRPGCQSPPDFRFLLRTPDGPETPAACCRPLSAWTPCLRFRPESPGPRPLAARSTQPLGSGELPRTGSSQRSAGETYAPSVILSQYGLSAGPAQPGPGPRHGKPTARPSWWDLRSNRPPGASPP